MIKKSEIEVEALRQFDKAAAALAPLTNDHLAVIEAEVRAIAQLEDRMNAATMKIRVHYNDGISSGIRLGAENHF